MQNIIERSKQTVQSAEVVQLAEGGASLAAEAQPALKSSSWLIDQYQMQLSAQNATRNYVSPVSCLDALYVEQSKKMQRRSEVLGAVRVAETNRFDVRSRRFVAELDARKLEKLVQAYRDGKYRRVALLRRNQIRFDHSWPRRLSKACQACFLTCKERLLDTVQECRFALEQLSLYYN